MPEMEDVLVSLMAQHCGVHVSEYGAILIADIGWLIGHAGAVNAVQVKLPHLPAKEFQNSSHYLIRMIVGPH